MSTIKTCIKRRPVLIYILLYSLLGGIGLALANRIGLGVPFVEAWAKREPISYRFRNIIAIAWIAAVGLNLLSLFLQSISTKPNNSKANYRSGQGCS